MALTRIKTDQIASGQVKSDDLDPNISLPAGAGFSDNSISGNVIDGGTISNFASTGIDDNATTTALTINSDGSITCTGALGVSGNTTLAGELRGPASFIIDPAAIGDDTGTVVIKGNLQVDGTTTTINSTTLTIDDKNIVLASGAADSAAADGAGISVDGASATINYVHAGTKWQLNKNVDITANTTSTSTTTGALTVAGGVGIAGALNVGNNINVGGAVVTPDQSKYEYTASVYPKVKPTLSLDFANSESVDKRITFTRSTNATYYDASGILRTAYADQPRIDFDPATGECKGLLIEEQRSNILINSNQMHLYSTGACIVSPFSMTKAPDGSLTAYEVIGIGGNVQHYFVQNASYSPGTYTLTVCAKAGEITTAYLELGRTWAFVNLMTGEMYNTGSFAGGANWTFISAGSQSIGDGWFRIRITGSCTVATIDQGIKMHPSDILANLTGNQRFYVWGPQIEAGAFATSYIPSTTTFTSRASSATYFDSTGVLRIAGTNQPRYGYGYDTASGKWVSQGLVLEAAVTNTQAHSNGVTGYEIGTGLVLDQVAPDLSACYRAETFMFSTFSDGLNDILVQSFYVKKVNWRYIRLGWSGVGPNNSNLGGVTDVGADAIFDFDTGTFSTFGSRVNGRWRVQNAGNGWYRLWITYTNGQTYAGGNSFILLAASGTDFTPITGYSFAAWGAQHEVGTVPTSYIPTTTSSVTRTADVSTSVATTRVAEDASINLSNIFNSKEGTLLFQTGVSTYIGDSRGFWQLDAGSVTDRQQFLYANYATSGNYYPSTIIPTGYVTGTQTGPFKNVFAYDQTSKTIAFNGNTSHTANEITSFASTTTLRLGYAYATPRVCAPISRIVYYPKRLSNAELQAITE